MYLDISNLSADQIKKIEYSFENSPPSGNKISLVKMMVREGVNNFDVDSFYASLKAYMVTN